MTNGNTASTPTLNVSGTGAAAIKYAGSAPRSNTLPAGIVAEFVWDGTYWQLENPAGLIKAGEYAQLLPGNWRVTDSMCVYTVTIPRLKADGNYIVGPAPNTTREQIKAAREAGIIGSVQGDGWFELHALDDRPLIEIPITISGVI
jgi:hypothetical protein